MQQQWVLLTATNLGWVMLSILTTERDYTKTTNSELRSHAECGKANTQIFKSYSKRYSWTHQLETKLTLTDRWGPIHLQPLSESAGQNLTAHQGEARQARVPDNVPCEVMYTSNQKNKQSSPKKRAWKPFTLTPSHYTHTHIRSKGIKTPQQQHLKQ